MISKGTIMAEKEIDSKRERPPDTTAFALRGKQSVRATFKLSERAIESLSLVALHLGIKQKSLFDHLIDNSAELGNIAENIEIKKFNKIVRIQKTFVLSRRTLDILSLISKSYNTPRDALVEYSIQRLEDVIRAEKKRHETRKMLFNEVAGYWEKGKNILKKSRDILGPDDPFCINIEKSVIACSKAKAELELFIEKSRVIEDY